jgi:hypothetical protein
MTVSLYRYQPGAFRIIYEFDDRAIANFAHDLIDDGERDQELFLWADEISEAVVNG